MGPKTQEQQPYQQQRASPNGNGEMGTDARPPEKKRRVKAYSAHHTAEMAIQRRREQVGLPPAPDISEEVDADAEPAAAKNDRQDSTAQHADAAALPEIASTVEQNDSEQRNGCLSLTSLQRQSKHLSRCLVELTQEGHHPSSRFTGEPDIPKHLPPFAYSRILKA